ncbi:MAG: Gx transporter family protein [Firmicutes bacterium]|nr:Gx transporter family protein [[Eubacterium] siraeum]MCM1488980.1 Gx transporter family protein [Bacillota bacterium]
MSVNSKIRRLTQLALLTAIALIIFTVEMNIPNPTPIAGIKLGLANIVTVYGVYRYKAGEISLVLFARILLGSLFSANPSAILYSLAGGTLCLLGMLLLKKIIPQNRLWLCSVLGAVLHNTGQLLAAFLLMKTAAVFAYLPFLTVSGCIAGLFTGICAQLLLTRMSKKKGGKKHGEIP